MGLDIRWPIGLMFSLVGVLMVGYGLATGSDTAMYQRSLGMNINLIWGIVLLIFAAAALLWANSPIADTYHHFWDAPLTVAFGDFSITRSLHFVINDGLMTIFFLVVGMEIRREMHEGALADLRAAALPLPGTRSTC